MAVRTQAELNRAIREAIANDRVVVDAPADLTLSAGHGDRVEIETRGSTRLIAWSTARIYALENSRIVARDRSYVRAYDNARVRALENTSIVAGGNSNILASGRAAVDAFGSAYVAAYGNSTVDSRSDSRVLLWSHANACVYGTGEVTAHEWSTVIAKGTAKVRAYGGSHVIAMDHTTVLLNGHATGKKFGRQVYMDREGLDLTEIDVTTNLHLNEILDWQRFYNVAEANGQLTLYKAVDADLYAGHEYIRTKYEIGSTVICNDWVRNHQCGHGLHLSPTPAMASIYSDRGSIRFLRCTASIENVSVVEGPLFQGPKLKASVVQVEEEVDVAGNPV